LMVTGVQTCALPIYLLGQAKNVQDVQDAIAYRAAHDLLHGAGLAFKDQADYHHALRTILKLEARVANLGGHVEPFVPKLSNELPDIWSRKLGFGGPYRRKKDA